MHEPKRPPLAPPDLEADTLAAKLRGYEPEIEDLLKRRIRRAVIKDLLAQQGIEVSVNGGVKVVHWAEQNQAT